MGLTGRNRRRDWLTGLTLLLLCLCFTECSGNKDKKAALEAVNESLDRDAFALPLDLGRVGEACGDIPAFATTPDLAAQARYYSAKKAGLITITPDGANFWKVELVHRDPELLERLAKDKHNQQNGCNSVPFLFEVAVRSVSELVNLQRITDEKSEAEFTWKWDLTPEGQKLVNALSPAERIQLSDKLQHVQSDGVYRPFPDDLAFNLADLSRSSRPRPAKMMLKRSGNGWVVDE